MTKIEFLLNSQGWYLTVLELNFTLGTIQAHCKIAYLDAKIIKIVYSLLILESPNFVFSKMEKRLRMIPLVLGATQKGIAPTREVVT